MGMTDEDRRRLKGSGMDERLGVKPSEAARLIDESRSTIYRLLATGELLAVKRGTTTLVLTDSIHRYVASLPPATFGRRKLNNAAA